MENYELNLGPERPQRNLVNGRFLKGSTPANKGKTWDEYMSKRAQKRAARGWRNLEKYRPRGGPGRPKRSIIAVTDDGRFAVFPFSRLAAEWCGGNRDNVLRCCRLNALGNHGNFDHRYNGVRFYFEDGDVWIGKINKQ